MILDELVLHNVGVFRGRHAFTLTPPNPSKPVVLVGALNGGGKTTFLDSLHLALFGAHARTSARRGSSYHAYLRRLIHHGVRPSEGAAVEVAFHVFQEGMQRNYRLHRSWTVSGSGVREHLDVLVDGKRDPLLTSRWAEQVEAFVPRGVAELFFFDGEKIETLAELDNARDMLRTAIGALLGLDLVDQLTTDLAVVERNNRTKLVPPAMHKLLDGANRRLSDARAEVLAAKTEHGACNSRQQRAEDIYNKLEQRLRLEGADLLNQRRKLDDDHKHLSKSLEANEIRLHDLASGTAPLSLVREQLGEVLSQAEREVASAESGQVVEVLAKRDNAIIKELRSRRVKKQTVDELEAFLAKERQNRAELAQAEPIVGLDSAGTSRLRSLIDHDFDRVTGDIAGAIDEQDALVAQLEDVARTLAAVPDERGLEDLTAQREHALRDATAAKSALAHAEAVVKDAESKASDAQRTVERLLKKATDEVNEHDDLERIVQHSERVRHTLAALRTEATRRNLNRIQALVIEALQRLLRKDRLVTQLSIDPETYTIELHGRDGTVVLPQQLSAGERQLLAVSLLWGLAQASGRPLPVVIDTPLGRLDGVHRSHLISRYFPQASHQVILLSTDQEIDQDAWKIIYPYVGHAYTLEYDGDNGHTTAEPGYFWPAPTA